MENPDNIFTYEHQLYLNPLNITKPEVLGQYEVEDEKFWVAIDDSLTEEMFLSLIDPVAAIINRSSISYFLYETRLICWDDYVFRFTYECKFTEDTLSKIETQIMNELPANTSFYIW